MKTRILSVVPFLLSFFISFCFCQTVEVDASKAAGAILRGNHDIRITGDFTKDSLSALVSAINQSSSPVSLDLSKSTGLTTFPVCKSTSYSFNSSNLEMLILPESTTAIDYATFDSNRGLKKIVLPQNLQTIDECAFADCSALASIEIPGTIVNIGDSAFASCQSLNKITIGEGITKFSFYPFRYSNHYRSQGCINTPIPVKTIIFPSTIKSVNDIGLFEDTLQTIYCYSQVPPSIEPSSCIRKIKNIFVPASALSAYKDAWYNYTIDGQIKTIPENMRPSVVSVSIEGASLVKKLLSSQFVSKIEGTYVANQSSWSITGNNSKNTLITDNGMLSVASDETAQEITIRATAKQDSLKFAEKKITISTEPYTMQEIIELPSSTDLVKFTIPNDVIQGAELDIDYVNKLKQMQREAKVPICLDLSNTKLAEVTDSLFNYDNSIREVILPVGIKYIRADAFRNCKNLEKINFPESLLVIESRAFSGCDSLKDVFIPDSVTYVDRNAFNDNTTIHSDRWLLSIHSVDQQSYGMEIKGSSEISSQIVSALLIPSNMWGNPVLTINIPWSSFPNLESVVIEEGVQFIENCCFQAPLLNSITLPTSVKMIANDSFLYCKNSTFYVHKKSFAEKWLKENHFKVKIIK